MRVDNDIMIERNKYDTCTSTCHVLPALSSSKTEDYHHDKIFFFMYKILYNV